MTTEESSDRDRDDNTSPTGADSERSVDVDCSTDSQRDGAGQSDSSGEGVVGGEGVSGTSNEGDSNSVIRRDRFSGGPARSFLSSMTVDDRIFGADLAVDRAHVVMLAECGVIDDANAGAILQALEAIEQAGYSALAEAEDVHEAIETAVVDRVGPAGGRLHTARSRNDEVATCIRYRLRADLLDAIEATLLLRGALQSVAETHAETVMPGYTHLQPAQPITVSHWALSYDGAIRRDTARLFDAYDRVNRSPLGSAAFAGTPFAIDRERTAALLGFDGVIENAMDAASSRDVVLEAAGALVTAATTLSGLAEDVILFANRGFVELSDEYSSTSSIMPQKKNPDTLELVRAAAGNATAGFTGLQTTLKGLPRAYNRDLQRATPHIWSSVDAVTDALTVAAGAISTADWNEDALAAAAGEGFSTATGVADCLAERGVPFRQAHEIVAHAATEREDAVQAGDSDSYSSSVAYAAIADAAESILDDPIESYVSRQELEAVLDPVESVAMRDSGGGPAPEETAAQLESARGAQEQDDDRLTAKRESLARSAELLESEVSTYV